MNVSLDVSVRCNNGHGRIAVNVRGQGGRLFEGKFSGELSEGQMSGGAIHRHHHEISCAPITLRP